MKPENLSFYSFFTKYSLMEEYGFFSGIINRFYRKILPLVPDENTLEFFLLKEKNSTKILTELVEKNELLNEENLQELNLSIKALCSKVVAFGLDNQIKRKFNFLELDSTSFETLFQKLNSIDNSSENGAKEFEENLQEIESLIIDLRRKKNRIGTTFHLTVTTRKILEYVSRIRDLIHLKQNIHSTTFWENLFEDFIDYSKTKNSFFKYIERHTDLVALEIVEHTSSKGGKYIAENKKEYWTFFYKSLFGGGIIALFAFLKIWATSFGLNAVNNAFLFSINYALCFVLVKALGGIIATKQPAMTASTLAKNIDSTDSLVIDSVKSITLLIRKVFRSQFISIIGNFLMALALSSLLMVVFKKYPIENFEEIVNSKYLIKSVAPSLKLVFFAAIAGFFLALSGLISGFYDNKMIASRVAHRIRNNKFYFKSNWLANLVEKKLGSFIGNVSLGFLLGTAFLFSYFVPFDIDIRHIAFSSANVGYAIVNQSFSIGIILKSITGVLIIGFTNFIISFGITLSLALKSRGENIKIVPRIVWNVVNDFIKNPLSYFIVLGTKEKE